MIQEWWHIQRKRLHQVKIAICDDERADLEQIVAYSKQYDSSNPVRGFSSGDSLLVAFQTDFYDLVFFRY